MNTKGFLNARQLNLHHAEHGADFGAKSASEYERLADEFLGSAKHPDVHECTRSRGDMIRFNPKTDEYGVLDGNGIIRTYFKPVPCASLPPAQRTAMRQAGRCHSQTTNLVYFQEECKKW